MHAIKSAFNRVFNWRRHPDGVFFLMFPLAFIGFSSMAALAVMRGVTEGKWGYSVIFAVGMVVLVVALQPALRMHRAHQRIDKDIEEMRAKSN